MTTASARAFFERAFPLLRTLRGYRPVDLRSDVIAGVTTAVMLIPQAMAYATLAGLPPVHGLYAATVPLLVYGLFGTSRQLAVGPVAMDSLLVLSGVSALATVGTERYLLLAITLSLLVGAIQIGLGLLRMGVLVNFLSAPVVVGFMSAAALLIGATQLGALLGTSAPQSDRFHEAVLGAIRTLPELHLPTALLSLCTIFVLLALQRARPRFPRALVVVVLGSLAVVAFDLEAMGVAVVGEIPRGLPTLLVPELDVPALRALLPTALTIAFVGYLEAISVATTFARRHRYELRANRELIGLGAANLAGGFFRGFPIAGGLSRTAVNDQAGARTSVAGFVTAVVVAITLLSLTPLFRPLPRAALAAIIVTAVGGLVDVAEIRHVFRVKRDDLLPLAATFATTLTLGIHVGIGMGVGVSLLLFFFRSTRPHLAVLGRLPSGVYRNVDRYPEARTDPAVLLIRLDAPFYFGNVAFLRDALRRLEEERPKLRAIVLDASGINQLDYSGATALREIHDGYASRGVQVHYAAVKGPVRDVLERAGFVGHVGEQHFFDRIEDADRQVSAALRDPTRWGGAFI